jgi:hypothetical protein
MDSHAPHATTEIVTANLRAVLLGLKAALGAWGLSAALGILMYRRVGQTLSRIERMLMRFQAGKLWLRPHRIVVQDRTGCTIQPAVRLPRRFGWLLKFGKHHAAGYGLRLQLVLDTPEMTELLASSEQAKRVLRPLCRALAVELPWTIDKPLPECGATIRRIRKPRCKPEPFRIPLPRGVLTAARRQGFGKMQ